MRKVLFSLLLSTTAVFSQEKPVSINIHKTTTFSDNMLAVYDTVFTLKINKIEAIQSNGNVDFSYNSTLQKIDKLDAYTLKPDGRKIYVPADKILTKTGATSGDVSSSDTVQKILYYPDIEVGDILYVQHTIKDIAPYFKGAISQSLYFYKNEKHDEITHKFIYPAFMNLKFQEYMLDKEEKSEGKNKVVMITNKNKPKNYNEPLALSSKETAPSLFISSAKSYEELGELYAKQIAGKIVINSAIQELANKITQGLISDKEKAEAIYVWMQKNMRYVALYLGTGGIVSNASDAILKNRFGDCKDLSTLFNTLLKAVKIESELVLINGTDNYNLPETPVLFATFNHMVSYIPSLGVYVDATSKAATLENMPFQLFNKQALHIAGEKVRLVKTPSLSTDKNIGKVKVKMLIDENGETKATTELVGKGSNAQILKAFSQMSELHGSKKIAEIVGKKADFIANPSLTLPTPYELSEELRAETSYSLTYKATEGKFVRL